MGCNCSIVHLWRQTHIVKQIYIFLIKHLHFTKNSPFSRQKSSLNGVGTAWAEGSHYAHPCHHCRTRGACSAHILDKCLLRVEATGLAHPDLSAAWAAHTSSIRKQLHVAFKPLPGSKLCSASLLLLQRLGGSSLALCLISWLTTMELACFRALFQSMGTEGWKEIQALALKLLPKLTVWSCEPLTTPDRKPSGLQCWQLQIKVTSHTARTFISEGAIRTLWWDAGAYCVCYMDTPNAGQPISSRVKSPVANICPKITVWAWKPSAS